MLTLAQIQAARSVVYETARKTPTTSSAGVNERVGKDVELLLKCENFQRTGSFKVRGAIYRLSLLTDDEKKRGVVAVSAGNHAQGVALAARNLGVPATVFMPETASIAKIKATEAYGAAVILHGATFDDAALACQTFVAETGAVYVSPYDDDGVICGQGSLGLEILDDVPDVQTVLVPIGGGGLFAGVATAIKESKPNVKTIGVQADGADSAVQSFHAGKLVPRHDVIRTICDGIAIKSPAPRTWEYIKKYADDVVSVPDSATAAAVLLLLERAKMVVEPSGAIGVAALMSGKVNGAFGKTVAILCGGNIDALVLSSLIEREMLQAGRYLHLQSACDDTPGSLVRLLQIVANERGNVRSVTHDRLRTNLALRQTAVELQIEVRDSFHAERIVNSLIAGGYPVKSE